jgi:uncharacterized protein YaaN involved in tellurite resistance
VEGACMRARGGECRAQCRRPGKGHEEMAKEATTKTETKLKLDPPEALNPVTPAEAAGLVPLKKEETSELEKRVAQFVNELANLDSNSPEFGKKVDQLTAMGRKEIAEAAGASNRFLDRPVKAIDKDTGIGADLTELRRTVEALDPKEATKVKKFLGLIPFGNRVDRYFDKYRSSQTHISKILGSLANGKDELLMDNAAIDTERANLWKTMHKLEQMVHISKSLDQQLEDKANDLDATEPAKAKAIRETALFYTRQRTTDLLTQMAVTVQGYLALDLVKKNNVELVKGVDRASTTTVAALRTAVTVAQALTNQKLVLEQIGALNTTTAGMIDTTGEMLKTQTGAIHEQAASSTIPLETLQRAFQNIYDTMDQIDRFKLQALDNMKQTVSTLSSEVEKSKGYIARAEGVEKARLETTASPFIPIESK